MSTTTTASHGLSQDRLIAMAIRRRLVERADQLADKGTGLVPEEPKLDNAQINALSAITVASESVVPIVRFIELQVSRRPAWQAGQVGDKLLAMIKELQDEAVDVANEVARDVEKALAGRKDARDLGLLDQRGRAPMVHYRLCREGIASFTTHYLYKRDRQRQPQRRR